jgi:hypothetical protein
MTGEALTTHFSATANFRDDFIGAVLEWGDLEVVERIDKLCARETSYFGSFALGERARFVPLYCGGHTHLTHEAFWILAESGEDLTRQF